MSAEFSLNFLTSAILQSYSQGAHNPHVFTWNLVK